MGRLLHKMGLSGLERLTRRQAVLLCCGLAGLIYFLQPHLFQRSAREPPTVSYTPDSGERGPGPVLNLTAWGAPVVWGGSLESQRRRREFETQAVRTGLVVFVVGKYSHYLQRFVTSAERYFLEGHVVTYYILTDNLRGVTPLSLRAGRELKAFYIAERPDWVHLSKTRMSLLGSAIKELIRHDVDYVFCADVDQEFINPVGAEILGDLVATFHPQYYNRPLYTFPYEKREDSKAFVDDSEGDYYYTSEFFGGLRAEVYQLALVCSRFILQDMEKSFHAFQFEESYLNRYLINSRPTRVLSPEYSWWDAPGTPDIPVKRILSLQRGCLRGPESRESYC
ncbi:globoside alpha-1,3-N-acetylgalactosaminyltransferase 1-like [Lepisosteus oculatus]|uniref:globoside alpha-1,3-N-acetylgalactosaminyltransferase 1-like n=1 Tax=Lepisosteus oculatus TaxID=7918 RepID=UPI0037181A36